MSDEGVHTNVIVSPGCSYYIMILIYFILCLLFIFVVHCKNEYALSNQ